MKLKTLLLIVPVLMCLLTSGQDAERFASRNAMQRFHSYYNGFNFDSLYDMYADNMKKRFSGDETVAFYTRLFDQSGKILSYKFNGYNGDHTVYSLVCQDLPLTLSFTLDAQQKFTGILITPDTAGGHAVMRNTTPLLLPFKGEWIVDGGGDTKEQNPQHFNSRTQRYAFDLSIRDRYGRAQNGGGENKDYYAFGQQILAPCAGEVVQAVDGVNDHPPHRADKYYVPGNSVIIKAAGGEYLFFAHLQQGSVQVKQGQQVKAGDTIGLCGNSGNSTIPHLHFHVQDRADVNSAIGVKCYFEKLMVNGVPKADYSPVKGDKIKP